MQLLQGASSSHLTRRCLQRIQPLRDFFWPSCDILMDGIRVVVVVIAQFVLGRSEWHVIDGYQQDVGGVDELH